MPALDFLKPKHGHHEIEWNLAGIGSGESYQRASLNFNHEVETDPRE